jgi:hypothetical protein
MRQKPGPAKEPVETVVKEIRRATRKHCSAEEKIRIVLEGLRGEEGTVISGRSLPARILLNVSASGRVQSYLRPVSAAHVAAGRSLFGTSTSSILFPTLWYSVFLASSCFSPGSAFCPPMMG